MTDSVVLDVTGTTPMVTRVFARSGVVRVRFVRVNTVELNIHRTALEELSHLLAAGWLELEATRPADDSATGPL